MMSSFEDQKKVVKSVSGYMFLISKKEKKKHTHTHPRKQKAKEAKEEKRISAENLTGYDNIVLRICSVYFQLT